MHARGLTYKQLIAFFIPLGVSSSLTSITHVIINGTLSRGDHAAFIIACYAVAFSLFGIIERPVIVFRQTASALVTDRKSFNLLGSIFIYVLLILMLISSLMAFTPLGDWIYIHAFNASETMVKAISDTFKVIAIVVIFSGIRGLYQGIIITKLETNWLTIGVIARVCTMFVLSFLYVAFDHITSISGAFIFLAGMLIECLISVYKGELILRKQKKRQIGTKLLKSDILRFYFPLVCYFLMQTLLIPIVYILLAKSENIELGIASFALAFSITQMILGFFMYTHQIVLQFYKKGNREKIIKFMFIISIIPTFILFILCYSPLGILFMEGLMGADEKLSIATLGVLKFFMFKTLFFPWVDFFNGFLMLQRQTNKMLAAQIVNLIVAIISLSFLIHLFPDWNGISGSIAVSLGELSGFIIVGIIVYRMSNHFTSRRLSRMRKH